MRNKKMITDFCVICGTKDNLHDHHIVCKKSILKPISGDYEHPTNLITLCGEHHGWVHGMKPNRYNNWSNLKKEGIKKAQRMGVKFGAKPKLTDDEVIEMRQKRESGVLIRELMKEYGLSKASVYRLL